MDINQILAIVLPIVLPPLVGAVTLFYKKEIAKLPANIQPIIDTLANQAVSAAEQSLSGAAGEAKFAAASNWLVASLSHYGVKLSDTQVKSALEQAVYYLKLNKAEAPAPAATAA
jgi:LL-H family phage holin